MEIVNKQTSLTLSLTDEEVAMLGDIMGNEINVPQALYPHNSPARSRLAHFMLKIYRALPAPQRFAYWHRVWP